mgnify:CR=1 FL=1
MSVDNSADPTTLHHALIDDLVERNLITSPPVEAAFRAVRRQHFLPELPPEKVYEDRAIPTKMDGSGRPISSSSQPAIMAIMLEQLDLQPGHHVLEIGAGTGYNAALMAHIAGGQGSVTTVDIDDDLVEAARTNLAAAGFDEVAVICGDGMFGHPGNAPYDRIILTVAGWDIPPEWLAQLKPDGRLVLPLSFYGPQLSIAFERRDGHLASHSVKACGFVPVRGPRSEPLHKIQIGAGWDAILMEIPGGQTRAPDPAVLAARLRQPYQEQPTGLELTAGELLFKWQLWFGLHEPQLVLFSAARQEETEDLVPDLLPPWGVNSGILAGSSLAILAPPLGTGAPPPGDDNPFARTIPLHIRSYGPDHTVARRLLRRLHAWDEAGRPPHETTSVRALPAGHSPASTADATLTRRWHHYCIWWGNAA